jgi:hypothetical protein
MGFSQLHPRHTLKNDADRWHRKSPSYETTPGTCQTSSIARNSMTTFIDWPNLNMTSGLRRYIPTAISRPDRKCIKQDTIRHLEFLFYFVRFVQQICPRQHRWTGRAVPGITSIFEIDPSSWAFPKVMPDRLAVRSSEQLNCLSLRLVMLDRPFAVRLS